MKVVFLGPAWPYRGGIATIIERLARVFAAGWTSKNGERVPPAEVSVLTFRVQYPRALFPGRTQFRDGPAPVGLNIERVVNTINPFNWLWVGRRIAREGADLVVMKYWTPFMAPCFGVIARAARFFAARRGRSVRFVVQLDNIVPHERHWWDGPLTRFFVRSMDGFVAMSGEVERDLAEFLRPGQRVVNSPHPMFDHFGEKLPREVACERLGLDQTRQYAMFFGLVREYKGLDLLLEAWAQAQADGGRGDKKLLVAGEFYDDPARYDPALWGLSTGDVTVHDGFVPDDEVKLWFSVADVLILPYKSATQSGVTQIAYHFEVPMIVTGVGGLPEIVRDGVVGLVVEPTVETLRAAIEKIFAPAPEVSEGLNSGAGTESLLDRLRANFTVEKQRFSWTAAADAILQVGDFS